LLHAATDWVTIVFGFDQGDGDVRFIVENVIGALGFATRNQLASNDDAALGKINL
jgi:hypothetical protein